MTPRLRALAAAAVATAGLAALAPHAAQAQTRYVYDAHFDLRATYEMKEQSDRGTFTRDQRASFRMKGVVKDVEIVDGRVISSGTAEGVVTSDVVGSEETINRDANPIYVRTCRNAGMELRGPGVLYPTSTYLRRADPLSLTFVPFPWVHMWLQCDKDNPQRITFGGEMPAVGRRVPVNDHYRVLFRIPRDQLGAPRMYQGFREHGSAVETCPGDTLVQPYVRVCITDVEGDVQFAKRGHFVDHDDDLLPPMIPNRPALDKRARRAEVEVKCPRGCGYRIRTFLPKGRLGRASAAAAKPTGTTIAVVRGRLGRSRADRTIVVPIPAKHRPAVLRANAVLFEITLDPPRGKTIRRMAAAIPGV